jgi:hypothetical protein
LTSAAQRRHTAQGTVATARLTAGHSEERSKYARTLAQQHSRKPQDFGGAPHRLQGHNGEAKGLWCGRSTRERSRSSIRGTSVALETDYLEVYADFFSRQQPAQYLACAGCCIGMYIHTVMKALFTATNALHFERPLRAVRAVGARHRGTPPPSPPPPSPQETFFVAALPPPLEL